MDSIQLQVEDQMSIEFDDEVREYEQRSFKDLDELIKVYKRKAEIGDVYSMIRLGELYSDEEAAFRNFENAKDWTSTSSLPWYS